MGAGQATAMRGIEIAKIHTLANGGNVLYGSFER